jgi:hypothetical protein
MRVWLYLVGVLCLVVILKFLFPLVLVVRTKTINQ